MYIYIYRSETIYAIECNVFYTHYMLTLWMGV